MRQGRRPASQPKGFKHKGSKYSPDKLLVMVGGRPLGGWLRDVGNVHVRMHWGKTGMACWLKERTAGLALLEPDRAKRKLHPHSLYDYFRMMGLEDFQEHAWDHCDFCNECGRLYSLRPKEDNKNGIVRCPFPTCNAPRYGDDGKALSVTAYMPPALLALKLVNNPDILHAIEAGHAARKANMTSAPEEPVSDCTNCHAVKQMLSAEGDFATKHIVDAEYSVMLGLSFDGSEVARHGSKFGKSAYNSWMLKARYCLCTC